MSRRSKAIAAEAPGQDSFLDVVANLVGIFLILIIIVGSQAKSAVTAARSLTAANAEKPENDTASSSELEVRKKLAQAEAASRQALQEMGALEQKLEANRFELAYRRKELEHSTLQIELIEKKLKEERSRMSAEERDSISAQVELKSLQDQRKQIQSEIEQLELAPDNVEVVENIPSPKARKASIDEIEFRLKGGRVLYVPMLDIQKDVVRDIEQAARELQGRSEIIRSVGPLRGYKVHYRLYMEEKHVVAANGQAGVIRKPEADMQLEPVDDDAGELVEDALAHDSNMFRLLQEHPASAATVTLWVYSDSFGQFRKLRDALYKKGYLVAARPLPDGQPIGASTKGERSVGQ